MSIKSRDIVLSTVIPKLREDYPDGIVPRPALTAALAAADIPFQPWLTSVTAGRGKYDLSSYYALAESFEGNTLRAESEEPEDTRNDEDVAREVSDRFETLDRLAKGLAGGHYRSLILSGPPGVGKSFGIEKILSGERNIQYERISGYARATGLYKALFDHRESNHVVLFDDCDSIFDDPNSLNLLKNACDSTTRRHLAWRSEVRMEDGEGEEVPRHFEFEGRVVFVTNVDFEARSRNDGKLAPHLQAMMSRAFYLDLSMSHREILSRVMTVGRESPMLAKHTKADRERILSYVRDNATKMREVSLRTLIKLSQILSQSPNDATFLRIANATILRR